jgi:hypothetical protein
MSDADFASFAALSLIQPIFAFMDESGSALLARIDEYASRFNGSRVEMARMRHFVLQPNEFLKVPLIDSSRIWCNASTLC